MGILQKASLPTVASMALRRQQIKDLLADCPALNYVQSVDAANGINNRYDEYTLPFAADRRLRFAYASAPTATASNAADGPYIMKMFDADQNAPLLGSLSQINFMNPKVAINYLKCYEADRGLLIIAGGVALTGIMTGTSRNHTFVMLWGTSEKGDKYLIFSVAPGMALYVDSTTGGGNTFTLSDVADDTNSGNGSPSQYFNAFYDGNADPTYGFLPVQSLRPLTMDGGAREHEYMMQCLAPIRWQDAVGLNQDFMTPYKMNGFYTYSRRTVAPSVFDTYEDKITGRQYLIIDTYSLMEITGGGNSGGTV
jgi:hypothetical protein